MSVPITFWDVCDIKRRGILKKIFMLRIISAIAHYKVSHKDSPSQQIGLRESAAIKEISVSVSPRGQLCISCKPYGLLHTVIKILKRINNPPRIPKIYRTNPTCVSVR